MCVFVFRSPTTPGPRAWLEKAPMMSLSTGLNMPDNDLRIDGGKEVDTELDIEASKSGPEPSQTISLPRKIAFVFSICSVLLGTPSRFWSQRSRTSELRVLERLLDLKCGRTKLRSGHHWIALPASSAPSPANFGHVLPHRPGCACNHASSLDILAK